MNYNNHQPSNFTSNHSPNHYSSSNHGQHSGYSQNTNNSNQLWIQQHATDYTQRSVVAGSPSSPSPAHSASIMSGQYPAHHQSRQSGHGLPAWSHPSAQGIGLTPQGPGYFPPPHTSMVGPGRNMQGPPQHAHMSSDRHSPSMVAGAWKGQNSSSPSSPLYNLQMLVNQEMNSNSTVRMPTSHQQESVDLSSGSAEIYPRIPQQSVPLPLTRSEKQSEHSALRNGSIISSSPIASSPLNGEMSANSGHGTSLTTSSSPFTDNSFNLSKDIKQKPMDNRNPIPKESVSVIAQTPPKDKVKSPLIVAAASSSSSPFFASSGKNFENFHLPNVDCHTESRIPPSMDNESSVKTTRTPLELARSNPIIRSAGEDTVVESSTNISNSGGTANILVKSSDDSLSIPSPSLSIKDSISPVRSPKNAGNVKRSKKVDSILETLIESGNKKMNVSLGLEQPQVSSHVSPAQTTVIVSPSVTNDDSSSGFSHDAQTPSPGLGLANVQHKSPNTILEDEALSPNYNNGDDSENGKSRRKRKPQKPIRVSKTASDSEGGKACESGPVLPAENPVPAQKDLPEYPKQNVSDKPGNPTLPEPNLNVVKSEPVELESQTTNGEAVVDPSILKNDVSDQKVSIKSENDQPDDADDLLSVLASHSSDKPVESKPEVQDAFIEVETELEKMFAGIVESDTTDQKVNTLTMSVEEIPGEKSLEDFTSTPQFISEIKPGPNQKRGRPKGSKAGNKSDIFGTSSAESTPKKKKKQQKRPSDEARLKKAKKPKLYPGDTGINRDSPMLKKKGSILKSDTMSYSLSGSLENGRAKGPFVHIEGPKDNPFIVTIINTPLRPEDEDGGDKSGTKKQPASGVKRKRYDLEYRGKVSHASSSGRGLFSSTLSARYDALTSDPTWICVFCKRGPHSVPGQGDLFGPYLVGREKPDDGFPDIFSNCEPSADEKDITAEQKKGGKNKRSLRGAEMVEQFRQNISKKSALQIRRSVSQDSAPMLGMVPVSSSGSKDEGCFEVWVHEECIVWAPGVHLIGSRVVGLQEAVWSAIRTTCSTCDQGGANIGCVKRGCAPRVHYGCGKNQGWDLDEETYIAHCKQHSTHGNFAPT